MTLSRNAQVTLALALAALMAAFLILDRWMVTDLGVRSFGRIWAFYINYADFGFVRRGLVGTILQGTALTSLFSNAYHFAIAVQHAAIVVLIALTAIYFLRLRHDPGLLFKAVVFLSPAFILQVAYTTGSLDIFVLILVFLNILMVRNVLLFSALLFVGPLVHELFLFTVPAQLTALLIRKDCDPLADFGRAVRLLALPIAAMAAAVVTVALFGAVDLPRAQYDATMARLIPHAVGQIDLWSGYFEVGSSIDENSRSLGFLVSQLFNHSLFLLIPVAYAGFALLLLLRNEQRPLFRLLLVASCVAPLLVYVVATDLYRWVGMSANMSLLLLMSYGARQPLKLGRTPLVILLVFSLFAPFGGAVIDNPLPMHKFVMKKLGFAD